MDKLDEFIDDIRKHPNANDKSGNKEASELLEKDSEISKALKRKEQLTDIRLKEIYGYCILGILILWVVVVCVFIFFQLYVLHPVSDTVIITLLTTTTTNIITLPIIILKYLFHKK